MRLEQTIERALRILEAISEEEEINIFQLSKKLDIRRNTISDYIDALETLGLVETELKKTVPPQRVVKLTPKGQCIVKCIE